MKQTGTTIVEEQRTVQALPEIVYTVLTTPIDMEAWLSNQAWCDAREGGRYDLRWHQGYHVHGRVQRAEKPHLFVTTWRGSHEPDETLVTFTIKPTDEGTQVTVLHTGFGSGPEWAAAIEASRRGWAMALQNLGFLLETGQDRRDAKRPMLGVNVGMPLDAEQQALEHLAGVQGIFLESVIDGMSAQAAGLRARDLITAIDGQATPDFEALITIMQRHEAGEKVAVDYLRGSERRNVTLELLPRPQSDFPDAEGFLPWARERYAQAEQSVRSAVAGLSDERAGRKPAPEEWSVKDTLAHLISGEQATDYFLGELILGGSIMGAKGNPDVLPEKLAGIQAAAPTLDGLVEYLALHMHQTLGTMSAMRAEIVTNRARYHRLSEWVVDMLDHVNEHVDQIKNTLDNV